MRGRSLDHIVHWSWKNEYKKKFYVGVPVSSLLVQRVPILYIYQKKAPLFLFSSLPSFLIHLTPLSIYSIWLH
jgi:hypothetical protein